MRRTQPAGGSWKARSIPVCPPAAAGSGERGCAWRRLAGSWFLLVALVAQLDGSLAQKLGLEQAVSRNPPVNRGRYRRQFRLRAFAARGATGAIAANRFALA